MATIAGTVKGINLLKESFAGEKIAVALVSFTLGAYTAASDNGQLTAISTAIANQRRDGKTITLKGACMAGRGLQGTTEYETGTWAVSGSDLTFNLNNTSAAETDAASGVSDRPLLVAISYLVS